MRHALDLHKVHRPVQGGHDAVAGAIDDDARLDVVEALALGDHFTVAECDAVGPGRDLGAGQFVALTAQFQIDDRFLFVGGLRAPASRGFEKTLHLAVFLLLVGPDGRDDEGDVRMTIRRQLAGAVGPIDPAGVGPLRAARHLATLEQFEDEGLVGGAALDHDGRVAQRTAQTGEGLVAVTTVGDDLGDHRVEIRRNLATLRDAGVDADPGAGREFQM